MANVMSIDPVFGVFQLPYGNWKSEPVAEQDVPLASKRKSYKPNRGPQIVSSNWRPGHREPEIPYQLLTNPKEISNDEYEEDLRRGGFPTTGVRANLESFQEPQAEEQPVDKSVGLLPMRRTMPGGKPGTTEDTFLSRLIAPPEDELEAARNGLRWHWALQNRWMLPGSKWNETVWQGVDRENQLLNQLAKQKSNEMNLGIPTAAEIRAREQYRGKIMDQYNKAIVEYLNGNWDDPDRAYSAFKDEVERLRNQYAKGSTLYGGVFDPEDLRLPPPVSGRRNAFTTGARGQALRKNVKYAENVNDKLAKWIDQANQIPEDQRMAWWHKEMNKTENQAYLDSVYEDLIKMIKDSNNTMADEEKQRLQILVLPENAHAKVVEVMKKYQNALSHIAQSASAKKWSQDNKGKAERLAKATGIDIDEAAKSKEGFADAVAYITSATLAALPGSGKFGEGTELPTELSTALNANKEKLDRYMKNMMLAANVAPHVVADMAYNVADNSSKIYNDAAWVAGRGDADMIGGIQKLTDLIPRDAMPISEMLEDPDFEYPTLNVGAKVDPSSNPQTGKEGKGKTVADDKPVSYSQDSEGGII